MTKSPSGSSSTTDTVLSGMTIQSSWTVYQDSCVIQRSGLIPSDDIPCLIQKNSICKNFPFLKYEYCLSEAWDDILSKSMKVTVVIRII